MVYFGHIVSFTEAFFAIYNTISLCKIHRNKVRTVFSYISQAKKYTKRGR